MRTEALCLDDIVDATDAIARFLNSLQKGTFLTDEVRQSAFLQKLIVVGEAAARLSPEFRARHGEIP